MTLNPRKRFNQWADDWRDNWRADLDHGNNRLRAAFDAFVFDHGFIRAAYLNVAQVDADVWRSSQPNPRQIKKFAEQGIRTIVNLRGPSTWGSYELEKTACEEHGIEMIDLRLYSRAPPSIEAIKALRHVFQTAERPLLMHCKSGADRAGVGAALYVLMMTDRPPQEALDQLSLRFGHIAASNTGVLDRFVAEYVAFNAKTPTPFMEWVEQEFDRDVIQKDFRDGKFFSFITDKLLARE